MFTQEQIKEFEMQGFTITEDGILHKYNVIQDAEVIIPEGLTSIGYNAFGGCKSLTEIMIPAGVTSIACGAFDGCSGLNCIKVHPDNPIYDSRNNCNAIIVTKSNKLIVGCCKTAIPKSVTSIGDSAFSRCSSLTSITIPESVTGIGDYVFAECGRYIKDITAPDCVLEKLENETDEDSINVCRLLRKKIIKKKLSLVK